MATDNINCRTPELRKLLDDIGATQLFPPDNDAEYEIGAKITDKCEEIGDLVEELARLFNRHNDGEDREAWARVWASARFNEAIFRDEID